MMRVVHVVASVSAEASGPSYAVVRLCESLLGHGCGVRLGAVGVAASDRRAEFLREFGPGLGPKRLGRSPALLRWLRREVVLGEVDAIHSHGLWMMPNVYCSWAARAGNVPLVVSPHGTMSPWSWASGSPAKRVFWPMFQRPALKAAACFHATAESEVDDIRRLGFRQPVAVIPIGIDLPPIREKRCVGLRTLLFLGRLHPKKGLDLLLPAWQRVQDRCPDWRLVIAGPDEGGHRARMEALAAELKLARVEFVGPFYGAEKWRAYSDADLFVLPTYSENFAITVTEALACGTPAIVTKGAPWEALEEHGAGWWVDIGVEPLAATLGFALSRSQGELRLMGQCGRTWAGREFSWQRIGYEMAETYRWVTRQGSRPPWVVL